MNDRELDRHTPLHEVIRCIQLAVKNLSDNEYIYADDDACTNINHEEVGVIINLLSHIKCSAVDISDSETMAAYMTMFED